MSISVKLNVQVLRKKAKQLQQEVNSGAVVSVGRYQSVHKEMAPELPVKLTKCQHVIAKEHGYSAWEAMLESLKNELFPELMAACEALRAGRMIILLDDQDRENEGDLCIAAELAEPEAINFMTKEGRGTLCLALSDNLAERLNLRSQAHSEDKTSAPFTRSIDAADGITSGVSAFDRSHTIKTAIGNASGSSKLKSPGHIFPLRARKKGVLERRGHTEGSVDLMNIAGLKPAAVVCEIMDMDGSMARPDACYKLAEKWGTPVVEIGSVVKFMQQFG